MIKGIGICVLLWISCLSCSETPQQIESRANSIVDSLFYKQRPVLIAKVDSLCESMRKYNMQHIIDTIIIERRNEAMLLRNNVSQ